MQLHQYTLTALLTPYNQTLKVPYFQRCYQWTEEHWEDLMSDIFHCYGKNYLQNISYPHFMGPVVLQSHGNVFTIIDGQQRLTSMSLLLLAFSKWLRDNEPANTFLIETTIRQFLLINTNQTNAILRLTPTEQLNNRDIYTQLINDVYNFMPFVNANILNGESQLEKAVSYFYKIISEEKSKIGDNGLFSNNLFRTITENMKFIGIVLDANEDANTVFETLNARGKPLESGDLIRNYIFMNENHRNFYSARWQPLENFFNQRDQSQNLVNGEFADFLRYYLIANGKKFAKNENYYSEFKEAIEEDVENSRLNDLFTKLENSKEYYEYVFHPEKIPNQISAVTVNCIKLIKQMNLSVFTSIFMYLFSLSKSGIISNHDLEIISKKIVSYSLRLKFGGRKTPSNKNIIVFRQKIEENINNVEMIDEFIFNISDNDTFKQNIIRKDIYTGANSRFLTQLLCTIIQANDNHVMAPISPTIEHVFPQNPDVSWRNELSEEEYSENEQYRNTLGNLTVVNQSLNSALSNSCFSSKRQVLNDYSIWPYERAEFFNNETVQKWNAAIIKRRSEYLANKIIEFFS